MTQQQVQDEILVAQLKLANLVDQNTVALMGGNTQVKWGQIVRASRGINVVSNRLSLGDISSTIFQKAYACMSSFVGNYAGGAIDPNAQNPGTIIIVENPAGFLDWLELDFTDFDPASTQGDGGRTTYLNNAWAGIIPLLSLASPMESYLKLGTDYNLVPGGGFILLPGGNKPEIYPGESIIASNYKPV